MNKAEPLILQTASSSSDHKKQERPG